MAASTIRVLAVVLFCLIASVGCKRSNNAEVTQAKAEVEAARCEAETGKAELTLPTSGAEPKPATQSAALPEPKPAAQSAVLPVTLSLDKPGYVTAVIESADGRRVWNLASEVKAQAGSLTFNWDFYDVGVQKGEKEP